MHPRCYDCGLFASTGPCTGSPAPPRDASPSEKFPAVQQNRSRLPSADASCAQRAASPGRDRADHRRNPPASSSAPPASTGAEVLKTSGRLTFPLADTGPRRPCRSRTVHGGHFRPRSAWPSTAWAATTAVGHAAGVPCVPCRPSAAELSVGRAEALKAAEGWERCTRVEATEVVEMSGPVEGAAPQEGFFAAGRGERGQALADRPSLAQACVPPATPAPWWRSRYVPRPSAASTARRPHHDTERARRLHHRPRPRRQRRLQRREPVAIRGHGQRLIGGRRQERADGQPAQHRRRGDQGWRYDQAGRRAAARGGCGRTGQLPRQCRRQRHLQGQLDIAVCDSFVGNVALKTAEGRQIRQLHCRNSPATR